MSGYKELKVYKRSYKAAKAIYEMTVGFPNEERYGITNQLRRAALSIPLNIAEGYAKRESQEEFKRFLMMALGSSNEVLEFRRVLFRSFLSSPSFGMNFSPVEFSAQSHSTSELLRTLLMSGCF